MGCGLMEWCEAEACLRQLCPAAWLGAHAHCFPGSQEQGCSTPAPGYTYWPKLPSGLPVDLQPGGHRHWLCSLLYGRVCPVSRPG